MNFVVFNPLFLKEDRLPDLIKRYRITEVFSLLPQNEKTESLLSNTPVPISVKWEEGEDIDSVKTRVVYAFVKKLSHPIIANGEYIGQCMIEDVFKESKSNDFVGNLRTNDPNILILINKTNKGESKIKLFSYIFNILRKHSDIDYKKRICIFYLPTYITTTKHYNWCRKSIRELGYFGPNVEDLVGYYLTEEGLEYRKELIKEEEKEWREQCQYSDDDGYEDDLKAELDYIRNNGGDWIDD